ncbi:predicted protein [Nematostella vectensis]|uniref:Alpha-type protein kinase domain-containing protein n=1 Tax=Nematostella vectensis TaxID=45351 RepID=A7SJY5_NEMVE|nr:predicted protein [Nematostella vectensis]|eukprot:XP_001628040.1 predicted protein [Nematostella vectensis]
MSKTLLPEPSHQQKRLYHSKTLLTRTQPLPKRFVAQLDLANQNPATTKQIKFVEAFLIEFNGGPWAGEFAVMEPFLEGSYVKHSSNVPAGRPMTPRVTPQGNTPGMDTIPWGSEGFHDTQGNTPGMDTIPRGSEGLHDTQVNTPGIDTIPRGSEGFHDTQGNTPGMDTIPRGSEGFHDTQGNTPGMDTIPRGSEGFHDTQGNTPGMDTIPRGSEGFHDTQGNTPGMDTIPRGSEGFHDTQGNTPGMDTIPRGSEGFHDTQGNTPCIDTIPRRSEGFNDAKREWDQKHAFSQGKMGGPGNEPPWALFPEWGGADEAFSHFTYHITGGQELVCDIQGVNNDYTDPQIHTNPLTSRYGKGNFGPMGIHIFLKDHHCNSMCKALGLPRTNPSNPDFDFEGGTVPNYFAVLLQRVRMVIY